MDPRHRKLLEAFADLRTEGKSAVTPIDVAVKLGLPDPQQMGGFFREVEVLGWTRPVSKGFIGNVDYELTAEGEGEMKAAQQRPEPPVVIEDIEAQLRAFLEFWTYDQPFHTDALRTHLGIEGFTDDDVRRVLGQMEARGMVEPFHGGGWYPA